MKIKSKLELQGVRGLKGQQGEAFLKAAQYLSDCAM